MTEYSGRELHIRPLALGAVAGAESLFLKYQYVLVLRLTIVD